LIVTFVAILLLMMIEPMTVLLGLGVGALVRKRALVEPVALGAAIALEIVLVVTMDTRGVSPMVLAARGIVVLAWAHLAHLFVHGYTPIEDDDKTALDAFADRVQAGVLMAIIGFFDRLRRPRRRVRPEGRENGQ